jgi:uncharacterized surface anchored protein
VAARETLTIFKVDEGGDPLTDDEGGACFSLSWRYYGCDGDDGSSDGTIRMSVEPGSYWLTEARPPSGYGLAEPREVLVDAGGQNEVTVINGLRSSLTIHKVDEGGRPLTDDEGGACFELPSSEGWRVACDADDGSSDGTITILATLGTFTLSETRAPNGYVLSDPLQVTIVGGPNEITVPNFPPETLTIYKVDAAGDPLTDDQGGACFSVGPDTASTACDGDDGTNDGTITLISTVGAHVLRETRAPEGYLLLPGQEVTVIAAGSNQLTVTNFPAESVTILKVNEEGEPLTDNDRGACFWLGTDPGSSACDSDDGVNDGTITLSASPGLHRLEELTAPRGYRNADPQDVTVLTGGPNVITVENRPLPILTIHKVDANGVPITDDTDGACFRAEYTDAHACDSDDGANDGTISLPLTSGWYRITETRAPAGYSGTYYPEDVYVFDGEPNEITVRNTKFEELFIHKVNEQGQPLTDADSGACFLLYIKEDYGEEGTYEFAIAEACDSGDGRNDGTITMQALPGSYHLRELRAPSGYDDRFDGEVQVVAGGSNTVTIRNGQMEQLVVVVVDENGAPVERSCFRLDGAERGACDYEDGAEDGRTVLRVPPGRHVLEQTRVRAGYHAAEPIEVAVVAGEDNEITVLNVAGEVLTVSVVDGQGNPVSGARGSGACFALSVGSTYYTSACDRDDGSRDGTVFLPAIPGTYVLEQGHTVSGYRPAETQEVIVIVGGPNTIKVVNLPRHSDATPTPLPTPSSTDTPIGTATTVPDAEPGPTGMPTVSELGDVQRLPSTGTAQPSSREGHTGVLFVLPVLLALLGMLGWRQTRTWSRRE